MTLRKQPVLLPFHAQRALIDDQQWRIPLSCDLVRLVILCRKDYRLVDELARFCVEVLSCRQRAFKKLTVRDLFPD